MKFFKNSFEHYKDKVFKYLNRFGMNVEENTKTIENWIVDFFDDGFPAIVCAKAIRDNQHVSDFQINKSHVERRGENES